MSANSSPRDTVPLQETARQQPRLKRVASGGNGHPLRRQGLTFVTHEVEEKKMFGLPSMHALLESAGLRKSEKTD